MPGGEGVVIGGHLLEEVAQCQQLNQKVVSARPR